MEKCEVMLGLQVVIINRRWFDQPTAVDERDSGPGSTGLRSRSAVQQYMYSTVT